MCRVAALNKLGLAMMAMIIYSATMVAILFMMELAMIIFLAVRIMIISVVRPGMTHSLVDWEMTRFPVASEMIPSMAMVVMTLLMEMKTGT